MKQMLFVMLLAVAVRGDDAPVRLLGKVQQTWPERGLVSLECIQGPREYINYNGASTADQINAITRSYEARWRSMNSDVDGLVVVRGLTNLASLGRGDVVDTRAIRTGALTMTNAADDAAIAVRMFEVVAPATNAPATVVKAEPVVAPKPKPEPYKPAPLKPTITRNTKKKN